MSSDSDNDFERDNDSLYVLPLRIIPLRTPGLLRARLVKDSRLETAVELFDDKQTGKGLISVDNIGERFGWPKGSQHPDLAIMKNLVRLPSFDVYSLRIRLREMGINVEATKHLKLSEKKRDELKEYMQIFTLPLINRIYGDDEMQLHSVDDIFKLFSDPDTKAALRKLKVLSSQLGIRLAEIPKFLEDFSDIYMSFAYYQRYLDDIMPKVTRFIEELAELRENWQMRSDYNLMRTCDDLEDALLNLTSTVTGRFENFNHSTGDMWANITAERFGAVRALITSYHTTLGGILCGLGLKMNSWESSFPKKNKGGLAARSEAIMSSIRPGLERILEYQDEGVPA